LALSRSRAILVRNYLHTRFQLDNRSLGMVPLSAVPPSTTHKENWDGICLVLLSQDRRGTPKEPQTAGTRVAVNY
jgi:hypothetical protein